MGKVLKVVKVVENIEKKPKVKKLVNNPGVTKASAKLNLKETRVPKILKSKAEIVVKNNDALTEIAKPLKKNKKLSKKVGNSVKTNVEQVPIMKTLKRKSNSENIVKLPLPKKKGTSPIVTVKKELKKKAVKESKVEEKPEIKKKKAEKVDKVDKADKVDKVDEEISKEDSEPQPPKTDVTAIDRSQVLKGVSAVLKLAKLQAANKKNLFEGEHQPIFLQVSCIKVPKVPKRQLRMMLPHSLVTETDDVVLFVGDLKKGRAQDFEPTINHYQDLLREHGCTQVKDVIPLTQVKTEYDQYELKRKLLSSYDYFLTDGKIAGHLSHLLGKIFITKRKLPTSIKMNKKNLKQEIDNALKKTIMQLHSNGNSHIVQVAHTAMKKLEILNNVLYACKNLAQNYPGGWTNIRSLILKTSNSLSVPVYITLKSKNKVKVPVVIPTRPKAHRTVSGELSTVPGNAKVVVKPDGTVKVLKYKGQNEEEVDKSAVKKSKLTTDKSAAKKAERNGKKTKSASQGTEKKQVAKESEDLSEPETETRRFEDSEDEIEEAEQAYLSRWQEESITQTPEEKKPKKKSKLIKKKKTKA